MWEDYLQLGQYGKPQTSMSGFAPPMGLNSMSAPDISGFQLPALGNSAMGGSGQPASIWDNFLSKEGSQGWGGMALGGAQGIFNAFMGMKQYGLAKDQLRESKKQFGLNYDAQRTTTNAQMEDRQRARVASNPTAYQSVGDYMSANGIKGR